MFNKPSTESVPVYYRPYLEQVGSNSIQEALKEAHENIRVVIKKLTVEQFDFAYAEGKWSIRQVLQHLMDTERIMSYRALRFSRGDRTELTGFDHELYAHSPSIAKRSKKSMLDEYEAIHKSTLALFDSLVTEELKKEGIANGYVLSAGSLGYIIAGHVIHHCNVIEDQYIKSDNFPG